MSDPAVRYRNELLPFLVSYSRLVMYSFGFQQSFNRGQLQSGNVFLEACLESATSVLQIVVNVLAPSGYLRYAADGHFVFAAFASAFLLKLLRPQFVPLLDASRQDAILHNVTKLIKTLASAEVSVDDLHTPKLYARFLDGLLLKRNQEIGAEGKKEDAPVHRPAPPPPPPIHTAVIQEGHRLNDRGLLSPTIQVEAPEGENQPVASSSSFSAMLEPNNHNHHNGMASYEYSASGASTIGGFSQTATHFSDGDVLMQGNENWLASMGAIDNPTFWGNGMVPGFAWPSPESAWQQPITADAMQDEIPTTVHQQQQQFAAPYMAQLSTLANHH